MLKFTHLAVVAALLCAGTSLDAQAKARRVTDPSQPRELALDGNVQVVWNDPAEFREIKFSRNRFEAVRGDWVRSLAKWIRKRAEPRLPEGTRLEVRLLDIDRAGDYEPGRDFGSASSDHIRIMRDVYPPRIELEFRLLDAEGTVVSMGQRKLTDLLYLHSIATASLDSDPLRYEKQLINEWIRKEFGKRKDA